MGLETQEELDELVAVTNNDYLVQVNRWLVRTIHGVICPWAYPNDGNQQIASHRRGTHDPENPHWWIFWPLALKTFGL